MHLGEGRGARHASSADIDPQVPRSHAFSKRAFHVPSGHLNRIWLPRSRRATLPLPRLAILTLLTLPATLPCAGLAEATPGCPRHHRRHTAPRQRAAQPAAPPRGPSGVSVPAQPVLGESQQPRRPWLLCRRRTCSAVAYHQCRGRCTAAAGACWRRDRWRAVSVA